MKGNYIIFVIIIGIMGFSIVLLGKNTIAVNPKPEIETLANLAESMNGTISSWSLHTREPIQSEKIGQTVRKLQAEFSHWAWSKNTNSNESSYSAVSTKGNIRQTIQIVSNENEQSYVLYTVEGSDLKKENLSFIHGGFEENYSKIFIHHPLVFSCIKGKFNGKLKEVLSNQVSSMMTALNAKETEALKEDDLYSISAYSKQFSQSLPLKEKRMNLQIGLREEQLDANTSFVIGTPIITVEY
ncbi:MULTISPECIES: YwmB family TATA-box binding protein [Bacillus]|uniref:YwmB family TATA-box binding protein n=1 Tax=Bacillus TaxID=1386 RepID=UPI0030C93268